MAFHGNAGNITDRVSIYEFLHGTPANVLAVEYQGYTFLEINGYCHEEASIIAPEKYRAALQCFLSGIGKVDPGGRYKY